MNTLPFLLAIKPFMITSLPGSVPGAIPAISYGVVGSLSAFQQMFSQIPVSQKVHILFSDVIG
jgi:hypothetical protein